MDVQRLIEALGLEALIPQELPGLLMKGADAPCLGKPRGRHPIRPYSRSKYRPHSGPAESDRRARQIAQGMLQVSAEHVPVQHPEGRQVKPHRSGGATRMWTDDYDMAY